MHPCLIVLIPTTYFGYDEKDLARYQMLKYQSRFLVPTLLQVCDPRHGLVSVPREVKIEENDVVCVSKRAFVRAWVKERKGEGKGRGGWRWRW